MADEPDGAKGARGVSTIQFPYVDLEESIRLGGAILARGGVPLDRDQLAAQVGQVPNSGAFGAKVGAARLFGIIDVSGGKYQLTPLGFDILDAPRAADAKVAAFLNVPLYRRIFEDFKGKQLPPRPAGLEQAMVAIGVSPTQKDRARQIFDRSARSAGFFPTAAEDRLVAPVISGPPPAPAPSHQTIEAPPPNWTHVSSEIIADPVSVLVSIIDMKEMSDDEQAAVWTLIRYLKKREASVRKESE